MHLLRPKRIDDATPIQPSNETIMATFAHALFDQGIRMQHNPHLSELAKIPKVRIHPSTYQCQNGDTVEVEANGKTIRATVQFDIQVAKNTVVIPMGFNELNVFDLGQNLLNGLPVTLKH